MPQLEYIGEEGAWVAGWPASDHDEPDTELAAAKVASGLYRVAEQAGARASKPAKPEEE